MKTKILILIALAALAAPAGAADSSGAPSAVTKSQKLNWTDAYKLWKPLKVTATDKIDRVGGVSSRPWAQTAEQANRPLFYDQRVHEPHFNLFWFGAPPK
jgi:hypothetical protein